MKRYEYSDDFFADTRMSFGDHIEELRFYMIRALMGFGVGLLLSFFIGNRIVTFIGQPVEEALVNFYDQREKALDEGVNRGDDPDLQRLNEPRPMTLSVSPRALHEALAQVDPQLTRGTEPPPADAPPVQITTYLTNPVHFFKELQPVIRRFGPKLTLKSLSVTEAFMVYFKVCIVTGLVISSPWVFYQLWSFVAAGLYPHERKYVNYYLPFSLFLFLAGVVVTQFVIIPNALNALLSFNRWLNIEPDFRLTEWMSFAIWTPVMAGLCFQTPLVMLFLAKIGVCTVEQYVSKWRIAMFVMVIAACIGPTVDYVTVAILWGSMVGLYALGIALVKWQVQPDTGLLEEEVSFEPGAASTNGQPRE